MKRISGFTWVVFCLFFPHVGSAHHLLEEPKLVCDDRFPCPPELTKRIQFWISVYDKYGDGQVIFHDTRVPERVYSVLETGESCSRRREPKVISEERSRVKSTLIAVADKLEQKTETWTDDERHFLELFPAKNPEEIREAADDIRCQEGNRDLFNEGIKRYGLYREMVVAELKSAGLPEDLQYLPFVESSYNPKAYSRIGAAGLWQIMPRTGRLLRLKINAAVDERFDPEASTKAAVRYIKNSYNFLQPAEPQAGAESDTSIGPFVITSYNYGTAGVRHAMNEIGPDFVKVIREYSGKRFRTAVQNFYTSFLAARHVARNALAHAKPAAQPPFDTLMLEKPISADRLSNHLQVSLDELRLLNPSLTKRVWKNSIEIPRNFSLRLPKRKEGWLQPNPPTAHTEPAQRRIDRDFAAEIDPGTDRCRENPDFSLPVGFTKYAQQLF